MCLSIPAKIIDIDGTLANASIGGSILKISLQLVDNIQVGDYVLVHTGFALEKIDEAEAARALQVIKELSESTENNAE
jgi:hydrogenase expression/formation protein HypC